MQISLSNSCLLLPVTVKQQQEELSRNHVPSLSTVCVIGSFTLSLIYYFREESSPLILKNMLVDEEGGTEKPPRGPRVGRIRSSWTVVKRPSVRKQRTLALSSSPSSTKSASSAFFERTVLLR